MDLQVVTSQGLELETANYDTIGAGESVSFTNKNDVFIHIKNNTAGAVTAVIKTPIMVNGDLTVADREIETTDGEEYLVGTFQPGIYNQDDGTVVVEGDGLEVATFQLR